MTTEIRPIVPEEFDAYVAADAAGFAWEPDPEQMEHTRAVLELDRTLASFEDGEIVGTTAIFSFQMTVPGGSLPTAGVTWVSVKPTHRRRGVLTGMMQKQLSDVRERGEPFAALWASESIIYGRFGYGQAAEATELTIDRTRTELAHEPPNCGRVRLLSRKDALDAWPALYDRVRASQPGAYSRTSAWWEHHTLRPGDPRSRGGTRFFVQYEEEGQPLGYARYRVKGNFENNLPAGTVAVDELMAATESAYAGLWRYLFGVDLVSTITAPRRRVDEPLLWMLADPRRLLRRTLDSLWVRIVDVQAALKGRRYRESGRLVLDVRDEFCPWAAGRYELEAGPDGSRCRPTEREPDVTLSAADLGAVYLGGARLQTLRRAGRVEGDPDALRRGDAMFSWDPLPWCPEVF